MHVTSLYAALGALLVLVLSARISRLRLRRKIAFGDGGIGELARAIRAQANTVEYLPLGLLLLLLLDLARTRAGLLHLFGLLLILGRVLHAWGLSREAGPSPGRFLGTLLTWLALAAMALLLIYQYVLLHALAG